MYNKIFAFIIIFSGMLFLYSCDKNENIPDPTIQTTIPAIDSISASKSSIAFGGEDPTILTVYARGGNLTYNWQVDLGDIIPQNNDASIVSFTGSPCCIGEKEIKCTATNDKGSVNRIVKITIVQ